MRIVFSKTRASGLAVIGALVVLASLPAPASADTGTTILERCTHGQSISGYSPHAYRRALQELPTEVEEYSDCANLIRRAQLLAASNGGSGRGGGTSPPITPLSPKEKVALAQVSKTPPRQLRVGGRPVQPGVVHASVSSALSSLPDPLLAVLAFLLACAVALGGLRIGKVVRAHRAG